MQHVVWLIPVVILSITLSVVRVSAADAPPQLALSLDQHRFSPEELRVKANAPFLLIITNQDKEDEGFEMSSLRIEEMIPGGQTRKLNMPALQPGVYQFVGEFHEKTAKGRIVVE